MGTVGWGDRRYEIENHDSEKQRSILKGQESRTKGVQKQCVAKEE